MMLTKRQLEALQDPELRRRIPSLKTHFERVDALLKDIGPRCSRLVGIWQAVLVTILSDERVSRWFAKAHPDLSPDKARVQGGKPKQQRQQERPVTAVRQTTTLVDRAVRVLKSRGGRKK